MKIRFILLLILFTGNISAQYNRNRIDLIDFSRFPHCDLYFTFQGGKGEKIPQASDLAFFSIEHNGIQVKVTDLQSVMELKKRGETELYIALVLDNSASMSGRETFIETALNRFIDSLRTGDLAAIINFGKDGSKYPVPGENRQLHATKLIHFSNSGKLLKKYTPYENLVSNTYIYDALYLAVTELNRTDVLGRKAIILFSDGDDLASSVKVGEVINFSKSSNIPVFCIDLNVRENSNLQQITKNTGGEYFFVRDPGDLNNLYQSVLSTLKSQYRITYDSPVERLTDSIYSLRLVNNLNSKPLSISDEFLVSAENQTFYSLVYLDRAGKTRIPDYTDFLSGYPSSRFTDNVLFMLGRYFKVRGQYNKAIKIFDKILRNSFSQFYNAAQIEKADIFNLAASFRDAQLIYTDLLKSNVDADIKAQAMVNLANSYQNEGNLALALQTYLNVTKDFEGTEDAAFSLYQSALIAVKTDSSLLAKENLLKILNDYSESKVIFFAKSSLAELYLKEGNFAEAADLLNQIISSSTDPDFLLQNRILLGEVLEKSGKFTEAVNLFTSIQSDNLPAVLKNDFNLRIIRNLYAAGEYDKAVTFFNGISAEEQLFILSQLKTVQITINGKTYIGSPDGSLFLSGMNSDPLAVLGTEKRPELSSNFPVDGQIYRIGNNQGENTFILPVKRPERLTNGSGVYFYNNDKWESVTVQKYYAPSMFEFRTSENGLFAVLYQSPKVITLFNIYFDFGQATLKKEAEPNLYSLTDELKELPFYDVEIHGHTDSIGTEEQNLNLSLERAKTVKNFLIKNGIDSARIQTRGFGEAIPIAANDNEANMAKNRRTEFIFKTRKTGTDKLQSGSIKYTVIYKSFTSAKEAYDEKRFLQKQGYTPYVLSDMQPEGTVYKVILGSFKTYADADDFIRTFTLEFRDSKLLIAEERL